MSGWNATSINLICIILEWLPDIFPITEVLTSDILGWQIFIKYTPSLLTNENKADFLYSEI